MEHGRPVLNRAFHPVHITTVKRAFCLLYADIARALDRDWELKDFQTWADARAAAEEDTIGLVSRAIRVPRVIVLRHYDRVPRTQVRFSRLNIFLRDGHSCQYCGCRFPKPQLNIDHVIPRTQGGRTTWDNVVASCHGCNRKKGGRTPEQAGMRLLTQPKQPKWPPLMDAVRGDIRYKEWAPFLSRVDYAYWNVELQP
ncbi:MAG: HNH endonuclease [Candidatus Methylomirabilis sp.]|nr:HNH endonuclease [Deltaproteobacteria bacterium]